ncbi:NAD-dependent epimerase/dehydratase family protein [Bacillus marinisedimentorum]|uniref:NAD-dependent epimerase/dehydratase family protein n=1 Tax=Bacillus marinisedimentorum TaxID=1821260 RepID=UPI000871C90A|nr:NAD-dependent epimerase/dehydratase family protein [Bacillus marinisedimentorum]
MKILVTGGAGFIGSRLAKQLIGKGHDILIMDNLHPYYDPVRKRAQLADVKEAGDFLFKDENLLNEDAALTIFKEYQPEAVVHLAAIPGVPVSLEKPHEYIDYDIKATVNALKAAGESGARHFIFASSSSVYGEQSGMPLHEGQAWGNPVSPYAAAKFGAEAFCRAYQSIYQFDLSILRFFTVYGPWGRPDMAIPIFLDRLLSGRKITLNGMGIARDFTYIDDIISGIEQALAYPFRNETFNLGAGKPEKMETLLAMLNKHFPEMDVEQRPFRKGDVTETWANISKAGKMLGYKPKITLEEGLERTIAWYKEHTHGKSYNSC